MEANIGHLPTKFGYKQMQGWKVIQVFVSITDGRTEDRRTRFGSLSLLYLGGLDKNDNFCEIEWGVVVAWQLHGI